MTQDQIALRNFTRRTLAEARRAELLGQRRYASLLRASMAETIAENRLPAPTLVDREREKRRCQAIAFAQVIAAGFGRAH